MVRYIFVFFCFFSVFLFGDGEYNYSFFGVGVTNETIKTDPKIKSKKGYSLRYGQQTVDWRTTLNFDQVKSYNHQYQMSIDNFLTDTLFGTPKIRPYLGATAGKVYFDKTHLTASQEYSDTFLGARGGFVIYTTDLLDSDIGAYYYHPQNIKEVDKLYGVSISLHYFYEW